MADLGRYARQMRYSAIGELGQRRLMDSRALICGLGALGSVIANTLVRAGVGRLRIVDRDFLELNNLQRQVLYDEEDVASGLPKAIAAESKLRKINSEVAIESFVADVDHRNIERFADGVQVIVDGTDNFDIRFLLNDASLKFNVPWIYGGCIGAEGQTMTIVPAITPCLRCLMRESPPPGTTATCDTAGILGPIINIVASWQANEAIKILSGNLSAISRTLTIFDIWDSQVRQVKLDSLLESHDCPACHLRQFEWLDGKRGSHPAVLCGRNAVQLCFPDRPGIDLNSLADKLHSVGTVSKNRFLLRLEVDGFLFTIFPDGRTIVGGTEDIVRAKNMYAKYIGA